MQRKRLYKCNVTLGIMAMLQLPAFASRCLNGLVCRSYWSSTSLGLPKQNLQDLFSIFYCYSYHKTIIKALSVENESETQWGNATYLLLVAMEFFTYSSTTLLHHRHTLDNDNQKYANTGNLKLCFVICFLYLFWYLRLSCLLCNKSVYAVAIPSLRNSISFQIISKQLSAALTVLWYLVKIFLFAHHQHSVETDIYIAVNIHLKSLW